MQRPPLTAALEKPQSQENHRVVTCEMAPTQKKQEPLESACGPSIHSLRSWFLMRPSGGTATSQTRRAHAWGPSGLTVLPRTRAHSLCGRFPVSRPQGKQGGSPVWEPAVPKSCGRRVHKVGARSVGQAGSPGQAGSRSWRGGTGWDVGGRARRGPSLELLQPNLQALSSG